MERAELLPIETAPKGGVMIVIAIVRNGEVEEMDPGCWEFIETSDWDGKAVYGWTSNSGHIEEPTHWMAMPKVRERPRRLRGRKSNTIVPPTPVFDRLLEQAAKDEQSNDAQARSESRF